MTDHVHTPALAANSPAHSVPVKRASEVPATRSSKIATVILVLAIICLLVPAPEAWFVDDSPQQVSELLDRAAGLADEDEYNKRDLNKVVDTLDELVALVENTSMTPEIEAVVEDMRGASAELNVKIEEMRGRDRMEPPLPGLERLGELEGHFSGIEESNEALLAFADTRLTVTAIVALLAILFLVFAPAFNRELNEIRVFGAKPGTMKVGHARSLSRSIILLCMAALVMIFQPNIPILYTVGMGLVVLGGLAFNLVPLAQPGRRLFGAVKAAIIVAVILVIVILLALGSSELYSSYLKGNLCESDPDSEVCVDGA